MVKLMLLIFIKLLIVICETKSATVLHKLHFWEKCFTHTKFEPSIVINIVHNFMVKYFSYENFFFMRIFYPKLVTLKNFSILSINISNDPITSNLYKSNRVTDYRLYNKRCTLKHYYFLLFRISLQSYKFACYPLFGDQITNI